METPNLSYIQNMSGGDISFEKKIISILKEEFPTEKKTYFTHTNSSNYKLTAEIVHKLKHKFSILGLEKGYKIAVAFENELVNENDGLRSEFELILDNITNYLTKL